VNGGVCARCGQARPFGRRTRLSIVQGGDASRGTTFGVSALHNRDILFVPVTCPEARHDMTLSGAQRSSPYAH